jgi:integrase
MQDTPQTCPAIRPREPWNKGKLVGAKPPLRPKHVWSIRTKLQVEGQTRDLANLVIDSKLRGCDGVALKVDDVAPGGYAIDRVTIRQRKTGQPVRFEMTEQTRQAVDDYIRAAGKKPGEYLFVGRRCSGRCMTTRQYARLVSGWIGSIGLDPRLFGTHSLRRTKPTLIYRRTGNLRAVQLLLGHTKIESFGAERTCSAPLNLAPSCHFRKSSRRTKPIRAVGLQGVAQSASREAQQRMSRHVRLVISGVSA